VVDKKGIWPAKTAIYPHKFFSRLVLEENQGGLTNSGSSDVVGSGNMSPHCSF